MKPKKDPEAAETVQTTDSPAVAQDRLVSPYDDPERYEFLAGQHKETGQWHGMLYRNQPTPSGCARWLLKISDNRGWETAAESKRQLRISLGHNAKRLAHADEKLTDQKEAP